MFRHRDRARTFRHNFRLAAFLSLTAGMVNIVGVLELGVLSGAFISNCLTEYFILMESRNAHHAAVFLELSILLAMGLWGERVITDLGIELSQLILYKEKRQTAQLKKSIGLRSGIILFFFLGCIAGG